MMRPGAFLDRDGVLNEEVGHLRVVGQLQLLPKVVPAIKRLNQFGVAVVVVTNQSAVARGLCTEEALADIHAVLANRCEMEGARIDRFYYCPHHPSEGLGRYLINCECRKPKPGLLYQAAQELNLDLSRSVVIGDKLSDLETGWRAGCHTVLVLTGYGVKTRQEILTTEQQPDHIAEDLEAAVEWVLRHLMKRAVGVATR